MKDKFVLNYKQMATGSNTKGGAPGEAGSPELAKGRRHNYLHNHRTRDSLLEYLDNLDD